MKIVSYARNISRIMSSANSLEGIDFTGQDLHRFALSGENMMKSLLIRIDGRNLELKGTWLHNSDMSNSDFSGAFFDRCIATGSIIKNSRIAYASMIQSDFSFCDFSGSVIVNCDFSNALLTDVRLENVYFNSEVIWPHGFNPVLYGGILDDNVAFLKNSSWRSV